MAIKCFKGNKFEKIYDLGKITTKTRGLNRGFAGLNGSFAGHDDRDWILKYQ